VKRGREKEIKREGRKKKKRAKAKYF